MMLAELALTILFTALTGYPVGLPESTPAKTTFGVFSQSSVRPQIKFSQENVRSQGAFNRESVRPQIKFSQENVRSQGVLEQA
jgi:hypothetical protein